MLLSKLLFSGHIDVAMHILGWTRLENYEQADKSWYRQNTATQWMAKPGNKTLALGVV